jgi:Outer membrane protein beta-barrel domain
MRGPALASFLLLSALAGVARAADVCVELDAARDNLNESERGATRTLLMQTLEEKGQHVVESGCQVTYRVHHIRLGDSVTVALSNGKDSRSLEVSKIEDVPKAYSQLVESLLSGKPLGVESGSIDRTNVTNAQVSPNRVEADSLWYLRLGYGGIAADGLETGPAFGVGYRYELDFIALDASLNFVLAQSESSYEASTGTWIRLGALYYFDPFANNSLYAGAAIGWGSGNVTVDSATYSNSGIDIGLAGGFEFLRASSIRLFIQFDATLPTYTLEGTSLDPVTLISTSDSVYAPSFALSLGLGFGKSNTLKVQVLD